MSRVAVVGAGFAGLSAAARVEAAGLEAVTVEARDRVGGRVFSRELGNGSVIEMGAEFILDGNTRVREVAADLGLGLWDKGIRYGRREPRGGSPVDEDGLAEALKTIGSALADDPPAAAVPSRELLDRLAIDAGARDYILARVEISCAAPAGLVPAGEMLGVAHVGDEASPSVAGGNQRIAIELARRLSQPVLLSSPVRRLEWSTDDGVRIATEGGMIEADVAIMAVPASVIGSIEFDPPLPDRKQDALSTVRYGNAAKLFVPLAEDPEPRAVMSIPERYWAWTDTGKEGRPQPVLHAFAGSAAALERLDVSDGPDRWRTSMLALRPDVEPADADPILSTWDDDPWVRGAYSVSPGPELTPRLQEPCGPLHFAGEYTAGAFSGLMEGALRSGERAAEALLTERAA